MFGASVLSYFATNTSDPPAEDRLVLPKFTVPTNPPVTITFPVGSTVTDAGLCVPSVPSWRAEIPAPVVLSSLARYISLSPLTAGKVALPKARFPSYRPRMYTPFELTATPAGVWLARSPVWTPHTNAPVELNFNTTTSAPQPTGLVMLFVSHWSFTRMTPS